MIHAHIRFERAGLDDDAATRAQNVNGFAGRNCAKRLTQGLTALPDARIGDEPVAEDWGWALLVAIGPDTFVVGCSAEDETPNAWQVVIGDNATRGFWPATRRRRTAAIAALSQRVEAFLRAQPDVTNVAAD